MFSQILQHVLTPPQNFVVTECYTDKITLSWTPVIIHHNLYDYDVTSKSFEYEILKHISNGNNKTIIATTECAALIKDLVPQQKYTFYVRTLETKYNIVSVLSEPVDITLAKNSKKINILSCSPRQLKWKYLKNINKIHISWKSPSQFYGNVSYELLFNDKVLGHCNAPPLILPRREIEKFDFTKGIFKIRSILMSKQKNQSKPISIPYPTDIRQIIKEHKKIQSEQEEKKDELMLRNNFDDNATIYIWALVPDPLPGLKLIPFGDPDFTHYSFTPLDKDNGIYLCACPSYFVNQLDHYFCIEVDQTNDYSYDYCIVPQLDLHYNRYWNLKSKQQIKFFIVHRNKLLHRFVHSISGGIAGMHHKYKSILNCIVNNMDSDHGITFKSAMATIIKMHQQWKYVELSLSNELKVFWFNQLEHFVDSIDFCSINTKHISIILLAIYWSLKVSSYKVRYRHLYYSLNA
eukprot:354343_1